MLILCLLKPRYWLHPLAVTTMEKAFVDPPADYGVAARSRLDTEVSPESTTARREKWELGRWPVSFVVVAGVVETDAERARTRKYFSSCGQHRSCAPHIRTLWPSLSGFNIGLKSCLPHSWRSVRQSAGGRKAAEGEILPATPASLLDQFEPLRTQQWAAHKRS